jgi:hypothetical protein
MAMIDDERLADFVLQHGDFLRAALARFRVRCQTMASDVLTVLDARGLAVPDKVRQRVEASEDLFKLDDWLRRAAVVSSAQEIFGKPKSPRRRRARSRKTDDAGREPAGQVP